MHRLALRPWFGLRYAVSDLFRRPLVRRLLLGAAICVSLAIVGILGLWWRLSSGPIELDLATPWLKAAIEENFGGTHTVVVGGTQLELDEKGRTSLRLRDIVVRDTDGTIVASAPKAEVGLSGRSLLVGQLRAQSLNLVGAEMAVRIETDGRLTVFAGADKRPIATATANSNISPTDQPAASANPQGALRAEFEKLAGIMAWIDALGQTGLDGHDLRELGLKNGNLVVDDRRNGKRWTFDGINASLTRPRGGGVIFRLESDNPERPWVLSAAMRPLTDGVRAVGIEARKVSMRDILLALRLNTEDFDIDLPVSASVRADVLADGTPQVVQGQLFTEKGTVLDRNNDKVNLPIDRADVRFTWDNRRRSLVVPFQVQSGGNQFTMRATLDAPQEQPGVWLINLTRGDSVIDPVILAPADDEGVALNRVAMRLKVDTNRKRIDLEQGDVSRIDTRASHTIGLALTGRLDYSGSEPHLAFGVAGTRMPVYALKRIWPIFAAADVRSWVETHISDGMVERVVIAGNAAAANFRHEGPPMPDDGLSVDIETSGTTLRPIASLPGIRDADLTVRIRGRAATVHVGRGTVEVAPGRRLNVAGGVFEVPDTHPKPAPARANFRIDGSVPAAVVLLSSEGLRDIVGLSLDPATTRGTITAQVAVKLALARTMSDDSSSYTINADLTNFAADKMLLGQRLEASTLKVAASGDGYQIRGDAKVNGTPAFIDLRKQKGDADAELRMQSVIDDAARRRLGMDIGNAITGAIPIKVVGKINDDGKDESVNVEADLTPVKIDNLFPGWTKPAGRPARAGYKMIKTAKSVRIDDLSIDGSGATIRGSVELDGSTNEIVSANFPVFALSDGDRVALKADRSSDGVLHVSMRGDIYDGRHFVKSSLAGSSADKSRQKLVDLDLEVKVGTVAGHNGETLRGLDLKVSRRGGRIRSFAMASKIGRDTPFNGDLRIRSRDNHQVIYFETDDAGALFRFTDMYPRMYGGQMWLAMDPPTQEQSPQAGTLYIRRFVVRGEPTLDRIVSGAPNSPGGPGNSGVDFSEMRSEFTRFPGKMAIRDGIVRGPLVGATVEGNIDYVRDDVHLRGTFVPFYGLNNMFGQIPIVGLFLGGGNKEGLLGINYEAVGPPGAPRITVNPVSAMAPGLLRKFVPSPGTFDPKFTPSPGAYDQNFIPPSR
jgi:hypothetical protein